ncbi:MAG: ribonuclease P [Candidatus Nanoarchaeia archaeon]
MAKVSKKKARAEALKEIKECFAQASKLFRSNPALAHRRVKAARRAAMRVQMPMPKAYARRMCKHCYHYLVPSVNSRVRIQKKRVIIYCGECKKFTRILI